MRIGVVADATCDLPSEFIKSHDIGILPVTIQLGDEQFDDVRDPRATRRFYARQLAQRDFDADTIAYSVEQTRELLRRRIVPFCDYAFCITVNATRASTFENAAKASFSILADAQSEPTARGPFVLRVLDSRTVLAGIGVLVAEAAKRVRDGITPFELRRHLDALRDHVCTYLVPGDLYYVHHRAQKKGERGVDWLSYAIGTALDLRPVILAYRGETEPVARVRGYERAVAAVFAQVARQIEQGALYVPHVVLSYGGELAELQRLPGYDALRETAARHGVELLESMMSAASAVSIGAGCVSIAYAGERRPFSE